MLAPMLRVRHSRKADVHRSPLRRADGGSADSGRAGRPGRVPQAQQGARATSRISVHGSRDIAACSTDLRQAEELPPRRRRRDGARSPKRNSAVLGRAKHAAARRDQGAAGAEGPERREERRARNPRRHGRRRGRPVRGGPVPHVHAVTPSARAGSWRCCRRARARSAAIKEVIALDRGRRASTAA